MCNVFVMDLCDSPDVKSSFIFQYRHLTMYVCILSLLGHCMAGRGYWFLRWFWILLGKARYCVLGAFITPFCCCWTNQT